MSLTRGGLTLEKPDRRGYIYVLAHPMWPEWHKVGRAKDLASRLNSFNCSDPLRRFSYKHSIEVENTVEVEKEVHKALAECYTKGSEWFKAPHTDITQVLEQYNGAQKT